jgi:hypothetical protein
MATKRKVKRFDEGGDARAGMGFAGTGSGLAGSGAGDASAGRGDADTGRNTGDASRGGGSREGNEARAGMSFAGTGSGLGGTGVGAARSGIGGDGPSLGNRVGDYVSSVNFDRTTQENNQAKNDFESLGLGLNNETKKYQLSNQRETDGTLTKDLFRNYDNPYAAQNEFNREYDRLNQQVKSLSDKTARPYSKGGKVKTYAKGGKVSSAPKASKVSSASNRGDGIAQRGKTKGRFV